MSRIGKQIIGIPQGTDVLFEGSRMTVRGPLATLTRDIPRGVILEKTADGVVVTPANNSKSSRSLWGTFASHVKNMVHGVQKPYEKKLILEGVGYKVELKGNDVLVLRVGFSHPVEVSAPTGITIAVEKNIITVTGSDKELVGSFTARIRKIKPPEPYKGKGMRYENEVVRRKQGKKAV